MADVEDTGPRERSDFGAFDEAFVRCYPAALESAMELLLAALPRVSEGEVLGGAAAYEYMVALRDQMVAAASEAASHYDSESWLRLIRRLNPRALTFAESGTMEYAGDETERVAENLAGTAAGVPADYSSESVPTVVSMRLARLMALAGMVNSLEGGVRSATKGVRYRVFRRRRPRPHDSDALREALREFDLRNTWRSAEDSIRLEQHLADDFDGDPPMLVVYRFSSGLADDQIWHGSFREGRLDSESVQFTVRVFMTGDETYTVLGRNGVLASFDIPEAIASLIVLGRALLEHVLHHAADAGRSLPLYGLLDIATDDLNARLDSTIEQVAVASWLSENGQAELTASQVIEHIDALYVHGGRSLPGPVLRERDGRTTVDVWAYTWHVGQELKLSPHTGGAIANLSATQFEEASQQLIDSSVLAPPPELRALRGRTLRLEGRPVTDVDAIALGGQKLFLISCKKFLLKVSYLAGEYAAARSGTARLNAALDEWSERIATFRDHPVGDNYDFSGYDIQGFILLPELVFTPRADSRELLYLDLNDLFFTKVESFDQFAATLEMASWPPEPPALKARQACHQFL